MGLCGYEECTHNSLPPPSLSLSGWYRREQYGDANMIFGRDVQLDFLDPVLRGLLEASIVENDCAISAPNVSWAIPRNVFGRV